MIETIDETIQQAQKQEKLAYKAKKQGLHDLKKHIHRCYGDDILDHYAVDDYFIKVEPRYDSSAIRLYIYILPDETRLETINEIRESEIEEDFRIESLYKNDLVKDLKKRVLKEIDEMETDVGFRVKDKEQFERLQQ